MAKKKSEEKKVGDDGFTGLEETTEQRRYSDYRTYLTLRGLGWDKPRIAADMCMTEVTLDSIIDEFGGEMEPQPEEEG